MTAPLHERLEAWAERDRRQWRLGELELTLLRKDLAEAAAALRPPQVREGGALIEQGNALFPVGAADQMEWVRAALAHLRRLAAALREIVSMPILTDDTPMQQRSKMKAIAARALAPAPAAEDAP